MAEGREIYVKKGGPTIYSTYSSRHTACFQLCGPAPFSHKPATHPDTCEITILGALPCTSEQDTGLSMGQD